ncbi:hypothetical protein [Lusitaniella coriacea]|uniref:hypothetical protein n=1 Tax=Lusitaniella coriacea TaxID=1983105 RepID=UPI003CF6AB53
MREEEIEPTFDAIEAGLKDLPPGERLTIHLGSFADDCQRQQQLDGWIDRAEGSELRYLLMGERARSRDLTREGQRKPKFLHLYCTYTVDAGGAGANDALEKFLAQLEKYWKTFTGEFERDLGDRAERIFAAAFADGYQTWEQLLVNKMGLSVRPLTAEELWAVQWERFNDTPPRSPTRRFGRDGTARRGLFPGSSRDGAAGVGTLGSLRRPPLGSPQGQVSRRADLYRKTGRLAG